MSEDIRIEYDNIRKKIEMTANQLVARLIEKGLYISTAESCTGGMIASSIVDVADASKCFNEGHVTYSNAAKMKYLNVSNLTLSSFGAVSSETVKEMALGLMNKTSADVTVVTSGIAGPTGGTKEKPVGLVYISAAYNDKILVSEYRFSGDRTMVRLKATLEALKLCSKVLDI